MAIIQNADNWFGRCNDTHWRIRGRALDRNTFNGFVGKDFLTFVEVCSDDPEAAMVQGWQDMGKVASQDQWQKQIYDLVAQAGELSKRPTQAQLDELKASMEKLRTSAQEAENKAITAEKKAAEAAAEKTKVSKELEDKVAQDTATDNAVNGFLRSLWKKVTGGK